MKNYLFDTSRETLSSLLIKLIVLWIPKKNSPNFKILSSLELYVCRTSCETSKFF